MEGKLEGDGRSLRKQSLSRLPKILLHPLIGKWEVKNPVACKMVKKVPEKCPCHSSIGGKIKPVFAAGLGEEGVEHHSTNPTSIARQGTSGLVGRQWDDNHLLLLQRRSEALPRLDIVVRETAPKAKQGPALLKPGCAEGGDPVQVWDWTRRKPGKNTDATFIGARGGTSHPWCRDRPKRY